VSDRKKQRTPENPRGLKDLPFPVPEVDDAEKRRARRLLKALRERYPDAECALNFSSPHELLIATILSAQTTDANVNKATPALFEAFPKPSDYANASPEQIEPYVRSLGFFRNKARAIHASMTDLVERFDGRVPGDMDDLLSLHGVARKTANVVLGNAFDVNVGFVVDTHIERLSKRFALAPWDATVTMVERHLCARFPRDSWADLSHMLIYHGRGPCKARGVIHGEDSICKRFCPDPDRLCSNATPVDEGGTAPRRNARSAAKSNGQATKKGGAGKKGADKKARAKASAKKRPGEKRASKSKAT